MIPDRAAGREAAGIVLDTTSALVPPSLEARRGLAALPVVQADHADLFRRQSCLHRVEVGPPPVPAPPVDRARIVFWNAERCKFVAPSAERLRPLGADVILLAEMDHGMARSGQRHTTRDLAAALGTGYAFGVEYVELALGDARERVWHAGEENEAGLHGGAILSPLPLVRPALLRIEANGDWWSGARKGERRIGGRIAMAATVEIGGREIVVAATHLESHSDPDDRAEQVEAMLDMIDGYAPDAPVVLAGDFNTSTLSRDQDARNDERRKLVRQDPDRFVAPEPFEPLFARAARRGYQWRSCNEPGAPTQRTRPDGTPEPPHGRIDWFFTRDLEAFDPVVVPAVDADGTAISDHEILTVTVRPFF